MKMQKSVLVVKSEHRELAEELFKQEIEEENLRIVTGAERECEIADILGERYLGVGVGEQSFREAFVKRKIEKWKKYVLNCTKTQPSIPA